MTALELREQVKRLLEDEGADDVTLVRMALGCVVDWLVEQEAERELNRPSYSVSQKER